MSSVSPFMELARRVGYVISDPGALNFDQVEVGDKVRAALTEEVAVAVSNHGRAHFGRVVAICSEL